VRASANVAAVTTPGVIGPFPPHVEGDEAEDTYDRLRRRVLWTLPYGLYVLGSTDRSERRNGMAINWVSQVSFDPKLIGVGVENTALTHELIESSGVFSLCTVARDDRAIIRKFTKPVDVNLDARTLNGFAYRDGVTGAPILLQAPAYVDCEVRNTVATGGHTFFIGEVMDCAFQAEEDTDVLRMEDTRMNYGG